MNYIFLRRVFGKDSIKMVIDQMQNEMVALSVDRNGQHRLYYKNNVNNWERISQLTADQFLDGNNHQINWGTRLYGSLATVNKADNVAHASHKRHSRRLLANAGIKIPATYFPTANLSQLPQMNFPVVVRPSYHHGGDNFNVLNTRTELAAFLWGKSALDWYISEIFQKTHEYRVHVAHGKVLVIQEKPLVEGEIRANYAVNQEEWKVLKWREYHPGICREAIRGVETLGLDFGAVDMMYNSQNDSFAVCEINTAPSIASPYMSQKYANYFDWLIRHNFPAHLPLEEDGKNVFYSEMLRE